MRRINSTFFLLILPFLTFGQQRNHTVLAGETLYSIARYYEVPIDALRKQNNLKGNSISIGQVLVIPAPPATGESPQTETAGSAETPVFHIVKQKETLASIARLYKKQPDEIRAINRLPSSAIAIGDTLWLQQKPFPPAVSDEGIAVKTGEQPAYHTVKKGENLYRIALLYNMSVQDLMKLNQLPTNEISVGQQLRILSPKQVPNVSSAPPGKEALYGKFVTYQLTNDEKLAQVLLRFRMDSVEFKALNPGRTELSNGDTLVLFQPPSASFRNPYATAYRSSMEERIEARVFDKSRLGQPLASGILLSDNLPAISHPSLRFGTVVFVYSGNENAGVFAQVLDRSTGNGIRISRSIATMLGLNPEAQSFQIGLRVVPAP
jgi:LysM repeat protein